MVGMGVLMLVAHLPTGVVTGTSNVVLPIVVIAVGIIMLILSVVGIGGAGANVWLLVVIVSYMV